MNHQSQFARSITPRVAAKAADARPSLLPASAATFNYTEQQTGTGTERGRARGVMCRFALAVAQDWSVIRGRAGFIIDRGSHPLAVCGTTRAGRPFVVGRFPAVGWLRGGSSRRLAINIKTLGRRAVQSLAQGHPSHFTMSSRSSSDASKIAQKRGQDRGFFSQGRGNVTRARGADD